MDDLKKHCCGQWLQGIETEERALSLPTKEEKIHGRELFTLAREKRGELPTALEEEDELSSSQPHFPFLHPLNINLIYLHSIIRAMIFS